MRDVLNRYWVLWLVAGGFFIVALIFANYLTGRQHIADGRQHNADVRNERQRKAICAILATIPGRIPPEIADARRAFARPGHPDDCRPVVHPTPTRTPLPQPTVITVPPPQGTVIIVRPAPPTTPTPAQPRTPSPRPKPTPSPSRTCITTICLP